MSELTTQITEKQGELDQIKHSFGKHKQEHKKLESDINAMADLNKDIERSATRYCMLTLPKSLLSSLPPHAVSGMITVL